VEKGVENVDFYFRSTPAMSGGTTCMILSAETPKAGVLVQANQKNIFKFTPQVGITTQPQGLLR
jgi:hypothetical protein